MPNILVGNCWRLLKFWMPETKGRWWPCITINPFFSFFFSPTDLFWRITIFGRRSVCWTAQFWSESLHQKMLSKFRYVISVLWFFFNDDTQLSLTYGVVWFWFRETHTGRLQFLSVKCQQFFKRFLWFERIHSFGQHFFPLVSLIHVLTFWKLQITTHTVIIYIGFCEDREKKYNF